MRKCEERVSLTQERTALVTPSVGICKYGVSDEKAPGSTREDTLAPQGK